MKLTFVGAAHEVTGSAHFLNACGKNILIDYGMEQGINTFQNVDLPVSVSDIDIILVTHAHIDHTGMLPALFPKGFKGKIYATHATYELSKIMLRDSAHIQEFEAEWRNRKNKRAGKEDFVPLYTMQDAEGILEFFVGVDYEREIEIEKGITVRFVDVGHLLGSASIEIKIEEDGLKRTVVFSGDIGNTDQPIIKDPTYLKEADFVIMESTYGDRFHGEKPDYVKEFTDIVQETFDRGGNVVIPSFAVGRTQEILYFIRQIKEQRAIYGHEDFEVYVDSPLAIQATSIFHNNYLTCFDEEAMDLIHQGINPLSFKGLKTSVTSDDSIGINFNPMPKIIISASGMCEAGRIRHHLKHNLWRRECTILFVGYQANGTLGRALVDGAKTVKLFGEEISVNAKIKSLKGVSGHADKKGLIKWVKAFEPKPKAVFLVHGDDEVCMNFRDYLKQEEGLLAYTPYSGSVFDLADGVWEYEALPQPIVKAEKTAKTRTVYDRLVSAGERLMAVISRNKGLANKDTAKFTDQINALCDKWDR